MKLELYYNNKSFTCKCKCKRLKQLKPTILWEYQLWLRECKNGQTLIILIVFDVMNLVFIKLKTIIIGTYIDRELEGSRSRKRDNQWCLDCTKSQWLQDNATWLSRGWVITWSNRAFEPSTMLYTSSSNSLNHCFSFWVAWFEFSFLKFYFWVFLVSTLAKV